MELWERSSALNQLHELVAETGRSGRVAVIAGEAGMGKSVLVSEFVRSCGPRVRVMWGRCDRLVTPRALGPLHDMGRQVGGQLAQVLGSDATQEEIFTSFIDELTGPHQRQRPVVVIEDAHWADEATLDWLTFLGRRIERLAALLVVTYRDDEVGAEHPLRGVLAALPTTVVSRITLKPLSMDCVARKAVLAGRDAASVYELTGGNPLLVTVLLKAEGPAVPGAVQDLILDRIRSLPLAARDLAQLVSVVPTKADAPIVAGATQALADCVAGGVLIYAGDGAAFRHELLRSAVEDALSPQRSAFLHRLVLQRLSGISGIDASRLVHHAIKGHDAQAVLHYGHIAGADAGRQGAHREAAAHYEAALVHADRLPTESLTELLEDFAAQAALAGRYVDGLKARQRAVQIRRDLGHREQLGMNLRWVSRLAWLTAQQPLAWEAAGSAITILEALPAGGQLAMAYSNQSQLHMTAYEHEQAITWGAKASRLAEEFGDDDTAIHASINIHSARLLAGETDAAEALLQVHERADGLGMREHAARALLNLANVLVEELADCTAAAPVHARAVEYTTQHDLGGYLKILLATRAELRFLTGEWAAALADVDAALAPPNADGPSHIAALLIRGRIQSARGDREALATLDRAAELATRSGEMQYIVPAAAARSEYHLWSGDLPRARAEAGSALENVDASRYPYLAGELAYRLWKAGATPQPSIEATPYAQMIRGEWAQAAGEWAKRGNLYLRAHALSGGDRDAAHEALRILDALGATRAALHLRSEPGDRRPTTPPV
jgi:hypothetical protein